MVGDEKQGWVQILSKKRHKQEVENAMWPQHGNVTTRNLTPFHCGLLKSILLNVRALAEAAVYMFCKSF